MSRDSVKNHVAAAGRMWNAFPAAMSEFKYACPVCGQHIKCDSSQGGMAMECPTCFQKITAPHAPESDDPKFIITGTKIGERPIPAAVAGAGIPIAPEPARKFPVAAIVFVVLLCAVVAAAFVFFWGIFKSSGNQTNGQTSQVTSASNGKQMPPPAPPKPMAGLASVIFAKGDSMVLEPGTAADEVKNPARAAFLAAFKADLTYPLVLEGPDELSTFPGGRVIPGSAGDIQWHRSFPGGLVIDVTLQGLVPGHKYILSINGGPQRAGNGNLVDVYRVSRDSILRYYDFSTVTTDITGSYHATFGILLPAGKYDVSFYVKEMPDFSIVLYHDFFQFTVE
jgi:DNA-directed RNA polymerase subunit RPC12/RpoP